MSKSLNPLGKNLFKYCILPCVPGKYLMEILTEKNSLNDWNSIYEIAKNREMFRLALRKEKWAGIRYEVI